MKIENKTITLTGEEIKRAISYYLSMMGHADKPIPHPVPRTDDFAVELSIEGTSVEAKAILTK
jgi:hypothetical protein